MINHTVCVLPASNTHQTVTGAWRRWPSIHRKCAMNQTPPKSRFKCFFSVLPAGMWASALRNSTSWYRHVGLSCWSHTQHQGCLYRRSPHSGCHVSPEIIFLPVFWNFSFVQAVSCATQHIYRVLFFFSSWGHNNEAKMAVSQESTLWGGVS